MTEQKHTPLPWGMTSHGDTYAITGDNGEIVASACDSQDADGDPLSLAADVANLSLIELAVNHHAELVDTLERAWERLTVAEYDDGTHPVVGDCIDWPRCTDEIGQQS